MPNNSEKRIRELTDTFVAELSVVIHEAALEAVRGALEGASAPAGRRGPRAGAKRKKAAASGRPRGGKRVRRSTGDVEAMAASILSYVKANPGCSATELAAELGVTTKDVRLPLVKLLEEKKLRTEGQARGTKYFAGGKRGRPAGKKKAGRKKAARKKATRKKTTRKKTRRKKAASAA